VGRIESIRVADIQRISAAGNYVELHLGGRRLLHRVTISRLADRLDPAMFVRVHRSTIVRIDLCVALSVVGDGLYALELRDGASVAVSARHAPGVRALLSRDT
jgi:two-component system LytT family response regulator